jgi:hypothetical protein
VGKLGHPNCRIDGGHDMPGDLVLHLKHVADVAIVTIRPDVAVCCGLDQLGGDAPAIAGLANTPLEPRKLTDGSRRLIPYGSPANEINVRRCGRAANVRWIPLRGNPGNLLPTEHTV